MTYPAAAAASQLRDIEAETGHTVTEHAAAIRAAALDKHNHIVSYLKETHGLTHANANALAHAVRQHLAGRPIPGGELLANQYSGAKSRFRPAFDELAAIAHSLGTDVEIVIQRTGVSFRRAKQFARVAAPTSARVRLELNLETSPQDQRVVETTGMCTHYVDIADPDDIDDAIASWIAAAYGNAQPAP